MTPEELLRTIFGDGVNLNPYAYAGLSPKVAEEINDYDLALLVWHKDDQNNENPHSTTVEILADQHSTRILNEVVAMQEAGVAPHVCTEQIRIKMDLMIRAVAYVFYRAGASGDSLSMCDCKHSAIEDPLTGEYIDVAAPDTAEPFEEQN